MHVLRFTLCGNQGLKEGSSTVPIVSSTTTAMNGRSWCPIITVYNGNCLTLDSWTEFVLTSTKTEKAHLKINITTNSIPRLSLLEKRFP